MRAVEEVGRLDVWIHLGFEERWSVHSKTPPISVSVSLLTVTMKAFIMLYTSLFCCSIQAFVFSPLSLNQRRMSRQSRRSCMSMTATKKTAAILGASGYTGAELMRLLANHPYIDVKVLTSTERNAGQDFKLIYPQFAYRSDIPKLTLWEDSKKEIEACDVAFCCLPHGTTQEIIAELAAASSTGCFFVTLHYILLHYVALHFFFFFFFNSYSSISLPFID